MSEKLAPIQERHEWFRGEDKPFRYTIRDKAGKLEDVRTWAFEWCLWQDGSTDVLISKTSLSGIRLKPDSASTVEVSIGAADSAALDGAGYEYALWRTDGGRREVLAFGPAVIRSLPTTTL